MEVDKDADHVKTEPESSEVKATEEGKLESTEEVRGHRVHRDVK